MKIERNKLKKSNSELVGSLNLYASIRCYVLFILILFESWRYFLQPSSCLKLIERLMVADTDAAVYQAIKDVSTWEYGKVQLSDWLLMFVSPTSL